MFLDGALLEHLVLVFRPGRVEVRPVLLCLPQHPVEHLGDDVVRGRRQLHHGAVVSPQRLGYQQF